MKVRNRLEISGNDAEMREFFDRGKSMGGIFRLDTFIPLHQDLTENERLAEWGTLCEAENVVVSKKGKKLIYQFDTEQSAPKNWVAEIAKQYPKLLVRLI